MLERAPAFGESQTTSADTLVFRRRNVITDTRPALRPLVKAIPWATLVLVLAIPVVVLLTVAQRHPDGWPAAWPALLDIWRKEPLRWLGMAGQLLLMPVIVWVVLSGGLGRPAGARPQTASLPIQPADSVALARLAARS
mgnify:CR=1 FL=1